MTYKYRPLEKISATQSGMNFLGGKVDCTDLIITNTDIATRHNPEKIIISRLDSDIKYSHLFSKFRINLFFLIIVK